MLPGAFRVLPLGGWYPSKQRRRLFNNCEGNSLDQTLANSGIFSPLSGFAYDALEEGLKTRSICRLIKTERNRSAIRQSPPLSSILTSYEVFDDEGPSFHSQTYPLLRPLCLGVHVVAMDSIRPLPIGRRSKMTGDIKLGKDRIAPCAITEDIINTSLRQ